MGKKYVAILFVVLTLVLAACAAPPTTPGNTNTGGLGNTNTGGTNANGNDNTNTGGTANTNTGGTNANDNTNTGGTNANGNDNTNTGGTNANGNDNTNTGGAAATPAGTGLGDVVPQDALTNIQTWLTTQLGVDVTDLQIVSVQQQTFTDSCLGLGQANESCATVTTPGFALVVDVNGTLYTLHASQDGTNVRMADPVNLTPAP